MMREIYDANTPENIRLDNCIVVMDLIGTMSKEKRREYWDIVPNEVEYKRKVEEEENYGNKVVRKKKGVGYVAHAECKFIQNIPYPLLYTMHD